MRLFPLYQAGSKWSGALSLRRYGVLRRSPAWGSSVPRDDDEDEEDDEEEDDEEEEEPIWRAPERCRTPSNRS